MNGPYETERQARIAAHALMSCGPGEGPAVSSAAQNRQLLGRACEAAGVRMGQYDDRIIEWLAGYEDAMCAVIAGLTTRAFEAGLGDVAEDTRRIAEIRGVLSRFDWEHDDRQYALERIERIADGGQAESEDDHWRDYNCTCSVCGALIGMFLGRVGWLHYRGDGTVASPVVIYDADHEATFAAGPGGAS
jgi:hypothetical protein